jgi:transposase
VAHVLVGKYADHLPLYRQSQIYARQGIELDRSTLADRVGRAATELRPLHQRLFKHLKRSPKLFMDETRAAVLDPGRGRTKTDYLWALARDDRPWGGTNPPAVVYLYASGRGAEHAIRPLAGFRGDGYAAYQALAEPAREGGPRASRSLRTLASRTICPAASTTHSCSIPTRRRSRHSAPWLSLRADAWGRPSDPVPLSP